MNQILQQNVLLLELLNYLEYTEIANLRQVSKQFKQRIDSIQCREQILTRDYPHLVYAGSLSTSSALAILRNIGKNKEIKPDHYYKIGALGILGTLSPELNEPPDLAQVGFLSSIKDYVSNYGIVRIVLISLPNIEAVRAQMRIIPLILLLSNCQNDWENSLEEKIKELHAIGVKKIVIGLNIEEGNNFAYQLSRKYEVVLVNKLTRDNLKKMIFALDKVYNN